ncbi:MAG TPA: DUF5663 domain-containing protein [Candidatus Pristimantibacillus sp.]|jgi:hypothetical protein|nr:DUF5663 domain-containing protein [Candidatus Pristimantibacillus sp.]
MIKLDDDLLQELGLAALPEEEKKKLLAHIYETLEMRVGMKLAEQMSDAQLTEFEQFIDRNDEAGALKWLETNFPNYKDVVAAEFERLKGEIRQVAPQILGAGPNSQAPAPQPPMPPADQGYYQQPQPPMPPAPQAFPPQQPGQWSQAPQQPPQSGDQTNERKDDFGLAA